MSSVAVRRRAPRGEGSKNALHKDADTCTHIHMNERDQALHRLEASLDSDFLRALSEPARVEILKALIVGGPQDVGQLSEPLPQERSVISRHIKVLESAGLVQVEREGRRRLVRLQPAAFIGRLEHILASVKQCVAVCCPTELP